jgi:heme exporter protein A
LSQKLEADNLCCVRGDRRLFADVGFVLGEGELLHVRGPNGAGKTTLLRMVCGLVRPEAGEVRWGGAPTRSLGEAFLQAVTYLGHLNAIKDDLTCRENLQMGGTLAGADASDARVDAALERMGLAGLDGVPVKVLSQGQKRRTALARLLVSDAPLWVLDEPFNALDVDAVGTVREVIRGHLSGGGLALLTTHQEVPIEAGTLHTLTLGA